MIRKMIDYCLWLCFVISVLAAWHGVSPFAPADCDNKCRLRDCYESDGSGGTACFKLELVDCLPCTGAKSLCNPADGDPLGSCGIDETRTQKSKQSTCKLVCTLNVGGQAEATFISSAVKYTAIGSPFVCK